MSISHHFPNTHQELSLFSYIPSSRQPQLLKILAGIAGMAPESFLNHHLVFKPKRPKAAPNAPDLFYLQLVARVEGDGGVYDPRAQRWALRLPEFPEVTRKQVVSRTVYGANTTDGDVIAFVDAVGYRYPPPPLHTHTLNADGG